MLTFNLKSKGKIIEGDSLSFIVFNKLKLPQNW